MKFLLRPQLIMGGSILLLVAVLMVGFIVGFFLADPFADSWNWLGEANGTESRSTTLRNGGLVLAGIAALIFAWVRTVIADRQAKAAEVQTETGQQTLVNGQFQNATEMLGSPTLAIRLGRFTNWVVSPKGTQNSIMSRSWNNSAPLPAFRPRTQLLSISWRILNGSLKSGQMFRPQ